MSKTNYRREITFFYGDNKIVHSLFWEYFRMQATDGPYWVMISSIETWKATSKQNGEDKKKTKKTKKPELIRSYLVVINFDLLSHLYLVLFFVCYWNKSTRACPL